MQQTLQTKFIIIILTLQAAFLRSGLYRVRLLALIFAIFVSKAPETAWKRSSEIVCDKNKSVEFRDCKVRVSVNFFWGGNIPRHAAIYGKVDRIGKADEHIYEQGDLVGQWVVQKLHNAEILIGFNQLVRKKYFKISPRRDDVEQADHRERDLDGDEDGDHNNEHHSGRVCVPLTAFLGLARTTAEDEDHHHHYHRHDHYHRHHHHHHHRQPENRKPLPVETSRAARILFRRLNIQCEKMR